ncbi:hypothetical protein T492DRAFT_891366 [Pavlovales sp. CCMP2436]|nr:hypothetical protein T492DRAFT_891366 [Pavlovales sp. CCMP2436]
MSVARTGQVRLVIDEVRAVHDVARALASRGRLSAPPWPTGGEQKLVTYWPKDQVAVGVKSGISMSVFGATIHLGDDPEATTIKADVQNAFGSIERSAVVEQSLLAP